VFPYLFPSVPLSAPECSFICSQSAPKSGQCALIAERNTREHSMNRLSSVPLTLSASECSPICSPSAPHLLPNLLPNLLPVCSPPAPQSAGTSAVPSGSKPLPFYGSTALRKALMPRSRTAPERKKKKKKVPTPKEKKLRRIFARQRKALGGKPGGAAASEQGATRRGKKSGAAARHSRRRALRRAQPERAPTVAEVARSTPRQGEAAVARVQSAPCSTDLRTVGRSVCGLVAEQAGRGLCEVPSGALMTDEGMVAGLWELMFRVPVGPGVGSGFVSPTAIAAGLHDRGSAAGQAGVLQWNAELRGRMITLFPLHAESPRHWTLLVVEKVAPEVATEPARYAMRYYDSLFQPSAASWTVAQDVMALLEQTTGPVPAIHVRCAQQRDGWSCGLHVLHNAEVELRRQRGERQRPERMNVTPRLAGLNRYIGRVVQVRGAFSVPAEPTGNPAGAGQAGEAPMEIDDDPLPDAKPGPVQDAD
jgi:hypothetical protein